MKVTVPEEEFDYYIAISRGGLCPCLLLSYKTKQKNIDVINSNSYGDENNLKEKFVIVKKDFSYIKDKKVLLIDDLIETGETIAKTKEYLSRFSPKMIKTYVLLKKGNPNIEVDYCCKDIGTEWVDFIYENDPDIEDIFTVRTSIPNVF